MNMKQCVIVKTDFSPGIKRSRYGKGFRYKFFSTDVYSQLNRICYVKLMFSDCAV